MYLVLSVLLEHGLFSQDLTMMIVGVALFYTCGFYSRVEMLCSVVMTVSTPFICFSRP